MEEVRYYVIDLKLLEGNATSHTDLVGAKLTAEVLDRTFRTDSHVIVQIVEKFNV